MYKELQDRFKKEIFKGTKTKEKALEKAYADMSRRANGHEVSLKEKSISWLLHEDVFSSALSCQSQEEFDSWHEQVCLKLKEIQGNFGRIGRSQKVINMGFKYLSCIDNTYNSILPFCHMTLDGYTLNWYKTIGGQWTKWSKIDDYSEYMKIQKDIRDYLRTNHTYFINIEEKTSRGIAISKIPFEAEFVIWEGEITNAKYNDLIKCLKTYALKDKQRDKWLIGDIFDNYLKHIEK